MHEGLGILREEYVELENEIFFGEKKSKHFIEERDNVFNPKDGSVKPDIKKLTLQHHKQKVRQEAVQVAAMACRIIQELT